MLGSGLDPCYQVRLRPDQVQAPDPLEALDHQPHAAVGSSGELVDHSHRADWMKVRQRGRLRLWVSLGHEREPPVATHDLVHEPHRAGLSDGERERGQREHDRVPQRQDREDIGDFQVAGTGWGRHQRALPRFGSVMRSRPLS